MMLDVTTLIEFLFTIIGFIITSYLIPYLKTKKSKEEQDTVNELVKTIVFAAEQIYKGSGRGEEKKQYVINWLTDHKITYNEEVIDAMIEAAVYDLSTNGLIKSEEK